jgi:hypothetical protein
MSEANVEIIRRHYEIPHPKGGKRREVGIASGRMCGRSVCGEVMVGTRA